MSSLSSVRMQEFIPKVIKHHIAQHLTKQYKNSEQIVDPAVEQDIIRITYKKADRKVCKAGSILTYTNKTLKQHWEEYIGNEDPGQVLNEIYTPIVVREKEGHVRCIPSILPKRRVRLNKIRLRELNREKTLILIRTTGSNRKTDLLQLFLGESISLPFGYRADRLGNIKRDERIHSAEDKPDTTEQVKNAVIYCCLRLSMFICCVGMDDEVEHVEVSRVAHTETVELERLDVGSDDDDSVEFGEEGPSDEQTAIGEE